MIPRITLLISILCVGAAVASEDDVLLDVTPAAVFQTGSGVANPDPGGTFGLTWGYDDRTDLGAFFHFDVVRSKSGNISGEDYTLGAQSWFSPLLGDFRPQSGIRIGMNLDQRGAPSLDAAFQARMLMQFCPSMRGFAGGIVGADLGQKRRSFVGVDLGLQFLL
ncbi:MAG TPA: hypothetical protein VN931_04605 [Fibrobacteria bacterium]|nr:hypothetical protein [Fibrobacteria bacterium]